MREKVLSFVACPECGTDLRIDSAQYCNGDKEEIYSGNLVCLEDQQNLIHKVTLQVRPLHALGKRTESRGGHHQNHSELNETNVCV